MVRTHASIYYIYDLQAFRAGNRWDLLLNHTWSIIVIINVIKQAFAGRPFSMHQVTDKAHCHTRVRWNRVNEEGRHVGNNGISRQPFPISG